MYLIIVTCILRRFKQGKKGKSFRDSQTDPTINNSMRLKKIIDLWKYSSKNEKKKVEIKSNRTLSVGDQGYSDEIKWTTFKVHHKLKWLIRRLDVEIRRCFDWSWEIFRHKKDSTYDFSLDVIRRGQGMIPQIKIKNTSKLSGKR